MNRISRKIINNRRKKSSNKKNRMNKKIKEIDWILNKEEVL